MEYRELERHHFSKLKTVKHILIYFLLFLAGDLLNSVLFDIFFSVAVLPVREWYVMIRMAGCLLLTYFLYRWYTVKVLHLRMSDFGITFSIQKWGVFSALFLPAFVVGVYLLTGGISVNEFAFCDIFFVTAASLMMALKAGILEEMLFRGYIMKLVENRWNRYAAILAPSFLFSLVHIPSMTSFDVTGILLLVTSGTLVGILFSLAACKENSVSNSALIHAVWNFVMVTDLLHITTVQEKYGRPLLEIIIPSDNILLTGGGFGIESSVVAIIGYALACGFIFLWKRKKQ